MSDTQKKVMRFGGFTILSGLGGTLVAGMIAWIFSTTLENKITFAPLTSSILRLTETIEKQDTKNSIEHNMIVNKLSGITNRINVNETKLFRVMEDCDENSLFLTKCRIDHTKDK